MAASLTSRNRSVSVSYTHIGSGGLAKRNRKCASCALTDTAPYPGAAILDHPRYPRRMPILLGARQRALLKARAHALEPIVHIGQAGVSDAALAEVDRSLTAHGLIKIKLAGDRGERDALATTLAERADAALVQQVGRIAVLWRPRPDDKPLEDR